MSISYYTALVRKKNGTVKHLALVSNESWYNRIHDYCGHTIIYYLDSGEVIDDGEWDGKVVNLHNLGSIYDERMFKYTLEAIMKHYERPKTDRSVL